MDFPDVWKLEMKLNTPKRDILAQNGGVVEKLVNKLSIVKMMSILLPEADTTNLESSLQDSSYFSVSDLNFTDILNKNFIEGFPKNGRFFCYPENISDSEEVFFIDNSSLHLKINTDKFLSLTAIELNNHIVQKDDIFMNFKVDLFSEKTNLHKLKEEISSVFFPTIVNIAWYPSSPEICSSSVAKYFSDSGLSVKLCKNKFLIKSEYGLKFPKLHEDDLADVSEYIGMVLLGCDLETNDISSYRPPEDSIEIGRGKVIHSKGFITQNIVANTINEIQKILELNPELPWIAVSLIFCSTSEQFSKLIIISKDQINLL